MSILKKKQLLAWIMFIFFCLSFQAVYATEQPNTFKEKVDKVNNLIDKSKYNKADLLIEELLLNKEKLTNERLFDVYRCKFTLYYKQNKYTKASEILREIEKNYPEKMKTDTSLQELALYTYYFTENYGKAIKYTQHLINSRNNIQDIDRYRQILVICYMGFGQYEKAIAENKKITTADSKLPAGFLYSSLASFNVQKGKKDEALKILKEASRELKGEEKEIVNFQIISILINDGKYKEAIEMLSKQENLPEGTEKKLNELRKKLKKLESKSGNN